MHQWYRQRTHWTVENFRLVQNFPTRKIKMFKLKVLLYKLREFTVNKHCLFKYVQLYKLKCNWHHSKCILCAQCAVFLRFSFNSILVFPFVVFFFFFLFFCVAHIIAWAHLILSIHVWHHWCHTSMDRLIQHWTHSSYTGLKRNSTIKVTRVDELTKFPSKCCSLCFNFVSVISSFFMHFSCNSAKYLSRWACRCGSCLWGNLNAQQWNGCVSHA